MPTQSSGPISFADLNTFLGTGRPLSINELYRGGTYVPDITPNDHVPATGAVNLQELYDTWANKTLNFTINVGSVTVSRKGYYYGYGVTTKGGSFGSISVSTFLTPSGPITIEGLYYSTGTQAWHLHLSSASAPSDTDLTFRSVSMSGYNINGVRANATSNQPIGTVRRWNWHVKSTAHPTSGTVSCSLNYYG
jgi:hypothetical protein